MENYALPGGAVHITPRAAGAVHTGCGDYGEGVPAGAAVIETLFDPEEAARKVYFIEYCTVR